MGRINPVFEKAGFVRVPTRVISGKKVQSRRGHSSIYGGRRKNGSRILVSKETYEKSRYARPVYFIFDNRASCARRRSSE
jgi:hypothetical protein